MATIAAPLRPGEGCPPLPSSPWFVGSAPARAAPRLIAPEMPGCPCRAQQGQWQGQPRRSPHELLPEGPGWAPRLAPPAPPGGLVLPPHVTSLSLQTCWAFPCTSSFKTKVRECPQQEGLRRHPVSSQAWLGGPSHASRLGRRLALRGALAGGGCSVGCGSPWQL